MSIQEYEAIIDEDEKKRIENKKKKRLPKKPTTNPVVSAAPKDKKFKNLENLGKRKSTFNPVSLPTSQEDITDSDFVIPPKKKKKKDVPGTSDSTSAVLNK